MAAANPQPLDSIVIGGGVVGACSALAMLAKGMSTMIVDPDLPGRASLGNAGHIAVEQVEPLASLATLRAARSMLFARGGPVSLPWRDADAWLPFLLRLAAAARPARFAAGKSALRSIAAAALPAWKDLLSRIDAAVLLVEGGHYLVWESAEDAAAGLARWEGADTGEVARRPASEVELDRIGESLAVPLAGGLKFEGSAHMADLEALARALASAFSAQGGIAWRAKVTCIEPMGDAFRVRCDDGRTVDTRRVVVAAGTGSAELMRMFGMRAPLIAERGYHVEAECAAWPADMPPVVFESRSIIATRFRRHLRIAGMFEFARADRPPDPAKWTRIESHVAELGIVIDGPVSRWMGARPTLPDYLPAIGRSGRIPGLLYAFGHQHLGLTLAAATGEAVAELAAGEQPGFDLAPFTLDRFRRGFVRP